MNYAKWSTIDEMKKRLEAVNLDTEFKKSGTPIMYDDKYLYIDNQISHNLVIGSTGSGKTQSIILPMLKLAMKAQESIVLNDPMGEICKSTSKKLKEEGYNVITLDFENPKLGNSWNPLEIPYKLYKEDNKDKSLKLLEDLGYYLFYDPRDKSSDPFWVNCTIDYFTGLVLYLFENAKDDEIHLSSVYNLSNSINKGDVNKFLETISESSQIYLNLSSTLKAPAETRGSIVSVFNQKIRKYISRENLTNMISYSDFDLTKISNEKTALFIVSGLSSYCSNLIPLLINQIIECVALFGNKEKTLNALLDEFDSLVPIKDFAQIIGYCRSLKIKITTVVRSYIHLCNMYSKEEVEILKMCFGNIIYLLTEDIYTLEDISKYCGNKMEDNILVPLITVEELKTLGIFEAIVIMPRMMPFRTKLLPDYEIDWGYKSENTGIPERKIKTVSNFELKGI